MSAGDDDSKRSPDSPRRDNIHPQILRRTLSDNPKIDQLNYYSRIPTLSPKNGAKRRITFNKTRTLKGAFQATAGGSGRPAGTEDGLRTPPRYSVGKERRKPSLTSPISEASSPPGELLETYRRINAADNLVDLVVQDEYDLPSEQARVDRIRRQSPPSPTHRQRNYENVDDGGGDGNGDVAGDTFCSDVSFPQDMTDESLNKFASHKMDEQRLKHATEKVSPILSKAKVALREELSFENLQRWSEEEESMDKEIVEPSFNIPKSWGARRKV